MHIEITQQKHFPGEDWNVIHETFKLIHKVRSAKAIDTRRWWSVDNNKIQTVCIIWNASWKLIKQNEMWCAVVNQNHMGHICEKGFLDSNFE